MKSSIKGKLVTAQENIKFLKWQGPQADPEWLEGTWPAGTVLKVVMESRFWDVGLTDDLQAENGYDARVNPAILTWDGITEEERAKLKECGRMHNLQMEAFLRSVPAS